MQREFLLDVLQGRDTRAWRDPPCSDEAFRHARRVLEDYARSHFRAQQPSRLPSPPTQVQSARKSSLVASVKTTSQNGHGLPVRQPPSSPLRAPNTDTLFAETYATRRSCQWDGPTEFVCRLPL